ncbi:bacterial hemoglobin-like [Asterias rubens]|uniref:bacterial hemoglobin-like n=1 Tax=Asterias rubens TaxID=7604 RepID=UPI0014557651|nr:bacterial hemoglobin-like [Asterias rubens]
MDGVHGGVSIGDERRFAREDKADEGPLGKDQIETLQKSWEIIADKSHENGITLIKRLLDEHPDELVPLFSFGKAGLSREEMYQKPAFFRHCKGVMSTLGVAVNNLGDLQAIVPVLEKLGAKHNTKKVKAAHFEYLQEAFVYMLQQAHGQDLNDDILDAWTAVFAVVAATMGSKM